MSMKVTSQMTFRVMQSEINNINRRLQDLRQEAATGKRFNQPSDDPSAVRPVLNYSKQIRANQRYQENMGMAHNKLQAQDTHLDHAENILVRAKQHTLRAINGSINEQDKEILADQVNQMKNELLDTANAKINERYLFAGYAEESQPFQTDANRSVGYHGDDNARHVDIAPGEELDVSIPGRELFKGEKDTNGDGTPDTQIGGDVFKALNNIETLMRPEETQVSGSFGGNYEGWEYEDANNFDIISFDLELGGNSLTGGTGISVNMDDVSDANSNDKKDNNEIANKIGEEIVNETGVSGSLGDDEDSVNITNSNGDKVTITRDGNAFNFKTTNGATFGIANFQEDSSNDVAAGPDLNRDAVMEVSGHSGTKGDTILQDGESAKLSRTDLNEQLGKLDEAMTRFRKFRGEMGINMNRVETSIDAKAKAENDLKQILGKYEDADIAETSSQIVQRETALKAALSVTSRMAQISILNYM